MKKIMFNDRYGLMQAVLEGRKTMTRRIIPLTDTDREYLETAFDFDLRASVIIDDYSRYRVGEEVAVAQSYKSIEKEIQKQGLPLDVKDEYRKAKGFDNKMFVRADAMPHRIRITNIKMERFQDISEEDCFREGIVKTDCVAPYVFPVGNWKWKNYRTPQDAFAALIDRISGKGTWNRNPWVFAYEFELINKED